MNPDETSPPPVEVARARDIFQARILAGLLESHGIPVLIPDEETIVLYDGAATIWEKGVRIEETTRVTAIRTQDGRTLGVETTSGRIAAPVVVNVAGPWGGQVAQMAGFDLPVKPYRRQVFVTQAFEPIAKPVPMILDIEPAFYFRGEGPGVLMGMSDPDEPSSFHTNVDYRFMEQVIEAAIHRAPLLEDAEILRGWGGLYAITPDDNPIIGPLPGLEGFYCAIGFSGHGFQQAPAVGRILSELILDGQTDMDLRPFAHDRFQEQTGKAETRVV